MNKILAACFVFYLILVSVNVCALKESGPKILEPRISPTLLLPDLTVVSAEIGTPYSISGVREYLKVPLTINFTNLGAGTYEEFNVGGWGKSIDGNAYGDSWSTSMDLGFWPYMDSYNLFEPHRNGVICDHLASGEVRTYELELAMESSAPPVTRMEQLLDSNGVWWGEYVERTYYADLDIGTRYEIHVMVDYTLDPDGSDYIDESNEMNNELVISGPWPGGEDHRIALSSQPLLRLPS